MYSLNVYIGAALLAGGVLGLIAINLKGRKKSVKPGVRTEPQASAVSRCPYLNGQLEEQNRVKD